MWSLHTFPALVTANLGEFSYYETYSLENSTISQAAPTEHASSQHVPLGSRYYTNYPLYREHLLYRK